MSAMRWMITAATLAATCALALPSTAAAQPDMPDPIPFLPGDVVGDAFEGGSFDYQLNLIESPPPATTDARGVLVTTNASGAQPLQGLPGSQLGNTDRGETTGGAQSLVAVGDIRPAAAGLGVNIGAGPSQSTLEDPRGQPPSVATNAESVAPTIDPSAPMTPVIPVEEDLG